MIKWRRNAILAVAFYAKKLGLINYEAENHVAFKHDFTKTFGILASCEYDYNGKVIIDIDAKIHPLMALGTIAHEMVHAKQYIKGELSETKKGLRLWKGKKVCANITYVDEPWEREAMRKEVIMSHQFFEFVK